MSISQLPSKLGASIGERAASICYDNVFSHPLTFRIEYVEQHINKELNERGKALAHLVSASTDVLAALESLLEMTKDLAGMANDGTWDFETQDDIVIARAAIAKARDES